MCRKKKLFGRQVLSKERQERFAVLANKVSVAGVKSVGRFSNYRQKRYFANSKVDNDTLALKRQLERYEALRFSKQQDTLESLSDQNKMFKEKKAKLNQAQTLLKSGYNTARLTFKAAKKLDGAKKVRGLKFKKNLKKGLVADAAVTEGAYWSDIGVQCFQMDHETKKLCQLRRGLLKLDKEVNRLSLSQNEGEEIRQLRNKHAEMVEQVKEQSAKVEQIERNLTIGTLKTLTDEGAQCTESLETIIKDGLQACISVKSMVKSIGLVGSLLGFATSLDTIVSNGNSVKQLQSNAHALQSLLQAAPWKAEISDVLVNTLINNMYVLKLDHVNRSIQILREEAKSAAAILISSTLSAGKCGAALTALATSAILAAPGLNISAVVLAALISAGLKGRQLYNALKCDREGVKLDVQIAEESARLAARSGQFYANAVEFEAIQATLEALMPVNDDLTDSIRLIRQCKTSFGEDQEAKEFYQDLENQFQEELVPICVKKLEYQTKYDLLQGELYNISAHLDQITVYKRRLQDDRSIERIAAEFSGAIKKADLVNQYKLFKHILQNEREKHSFLQFLSHEGIAVLSDDFIAESVLLNFIRQDKHMPRSLEENQEP